MIFITPLQAFSIRSIASRAGVFVACLICVACNQTSHQITSQATDQTKSQTASPEGNQASSQLNRAAQTKQPVKVSASLSDAAQSFDASQPRKKGDDFNSPYAAVTPDGFGAVTSVNPLASTAGLEAFKQGGNAIDAAIAIALTLGVVDSHNSGIGGGCFIVVHRANGDVLAIDAREMAPAAAHENLFFSNGKHVPQLSKTGALAIGIPGSLKAYEYLAKTMGKRPFSAAFTHGIKHAENGFSVGKILAARIKRTAPKIAPFARTAAIFLNDDKTPREQGDWLVQKDLAATYKNIAQHGADYFYKGAFAQQIEQWMQKNNGIITAADFAQYTLKLRQPVKSTYQGYTIYGFPPPSSGGVHVAQILNILSHFDLPKLTEAEQKHVMAEAMKLAFADRAHWMGDPDFTKVPKGLISKEYAATLAKKITLTRALKVDTYGTPAKSTTDFFTQLNKHTTHISTADKAGNWVSITTTLNTSFGSKVTIPNTGVVMNNQMDDFSGDVGKPNAFGLVGAKANSVQAKKRPLSSMSPTIITLDNTPVLTLGAAGGPTIINQVVQNTVNYLTLKQPLDKAIAAPRIHHQWRPDRVVVEGAVNEGVVKALKEKGHNIKSWNTFGASQAIALEKGEFVPVSEPRIQ